MPNLADPYEIWRLSKYPPWRPHPQLPPWIRREAQRVWAESKGYRPRKQVASGDWVRWRWDVLRRVLQINP